tara:strand:+ start:807 stop:1541 length:735 start_codon:yes stop_codon:yes gene_type:complete
MISKLTLQSIINKYYLGLNESVRWTTDNRNLEINFMTPTRDVIGKVVCENFDIEDSKLAIFDTKKLQSLISICSGELLLELEKTNVVATKLKISDMNFNLTYALADPLLIGKVGTVNPTEWVVELDLSIEDIDNLIKAKSALQGVDNMLLTTTVDLDGNDVCEFVFGDEQGHNNKITYQISGKINSNNLKIPFNSDMFKTIIHSNKDMEGGKLYVSEMGLLNLKFQKDDITSEYYMSRKAERNF